tara:strand:+ start:1186 stop:2520 length:1335 start_codon:yes stop_codon:yes gene_type:complete
MKKLLIMLMVFLSFNANAKTEYTKLTLENGMQAYLIEDHRQPIAINMVWYKAGAADEKPEKAGIAHLLEHLMFKGTDKIPPQEFSKIVARLGGMDNASTSQDYTNYYQLINVKNLGKAMAMEADRMENLKLSEEDFKTERDVVIQERKQRYDNRPMGRFYEKVMNELYDLSPYKIITIGTIETINNLTRQDALDWYNSFYAPNNAILTVIGDVTPAEFKILVEENFGKVKAKAFSHPIWPVEPLYKEPKNLVVEDNQIKAPTYYKVYRAPSAFAGVAGEAFNQNDIYNLIVLENIIANSKSSMLYQDLVLDQQIVNGIGASYSPIGRTESTFDFYLQVKDNMDIKSVEKSLQASINKFITEFNDEDKLNAAKTEIKASQIYAKDDAIAYARSIGQFLSAGGTVEQFDTFFNGIDHVTIKSLKQTAKRYLQSDQYMNAWLVPAKK